MTVGCARYKACRIPEVFVNNLHFRSRQDDLGADKGLEKIDLHRHYSGGCGIFFLQLAQCQRTARLDGKQQPGKFHFYDRRVGQHG